MILAIMLALLPACPADGVTANDHPVCVYDASRDNMSGKSFVAADTWTIILPTF